jgi:hypothetical protein
VSNIEQRAAQETDKKHELLAVFPNIRQEICNKFGGSHVLNGGPRRRLGFVIFRKSNIGLAIF